MGWDWDGVMIGHSSSLSQALRKQLWCWLAALVSPCSGTFQATFRSSFLICCTLASDDDDDDDD
eukprot:6073961-Karenia_brevis.AAC.1